MKCMHNPTIVDAFRFDGTNFLEISILTGRDATLHVRDGCILIPSPHGEVAAHVGDYIIKGEKEGDCWVCAPDVFEKSYTILEGDPPTQTDLQRELLKKYGMEEEE